MTVADLVTALGDLGIGYAIGLAATIFFAGVLYRRFRR